MSPSSGDPSAADDVDADDAATDSPPAGEAADVYCRHCGEPIDAHADVCPACGASQPRSSAAESVLAELVEGGNPFVAAAFSALFPGLGQIYNRELERGIAFMVASLLAALSAVFLVGFVLYPLVWIYAIYDAYTRAETVVEPNEPR